MASIEGAFIGLARYIRDHFPHLTWMPLWYGGIPFPDSYPPLLHVTVAAVSALGHISAGLAYHAVTAALYSLAPVALYWAAAAVGRRPGCGAFSPRPATRCFSPTIWLVPSIAPRYRRMVRAVPPGRHGALGRGAAHHGADAAAAGYRRALHRDAAAGTPASYFAAALAMAAAALSNWIGGFALALVGGGVPAWRTSKARGRAWL